MARAALSHDWLERGLLGQLEHEMSDRDALSRAANVCLGWWRTEIEPRLNDVVRALPNVLLPGQLVHRLLNSEGLSQLDAIAETRRLAGGATLGELVASVVDNARETRVHLERFATDPTDQNRDAAHMASRELVASVRRLPKTVVLP